MAKAKAKVMTRYYREGHVIRILPPARLPSHLSCHSAQLAVCVLVGVTPRAKGVVLLANCLSRTGFLRQVHEQSLPDSVRAPRRRMRLRRSLLLPRRAVVLRLRPRERPQLGLSAAAAQAI